MATLSYLSERKSYAIVTTLMTHFEAKSLKADTSSMETYPMSEFLPMT